MDRVKDTAAAVESAAEIYQRAGLALKHRDGIVFKDGETSNTFVFYHRAQMIQVSCHFFQSVFRSEPLQQDDGFGFFQ